MAKAKKKKMMTRAQFAAKLKRKGRSAAQVAGLWKGYSRLMTTGKMGRGKGKARKRGKKYRIRVTGPGIRLRANRKRMRKNAIEWGSGASAMGLGSSSGGYGPSEGPSGKRASAAATRRRRAAAKKAHAKKGHRAVKHTRKLTKAERAAISRRNLKKAWAARRGTAKKHAKKAKKHTAKKHTRRTNPFKRISVRIGGRTRKTYLYRTPKGRVRHLPEFALLGYKSAKAGDRAARKPGGYERISRRGDKLIARREKLAAMAQKRIMAGKDVFSPNAGRIVSFEEWKKMKANKKRGKKKGKKGRKLTKAQRAVISRRNLKKARAARKGHRGHKKTKKTKKHVVRKHGKLTKAQRAAISRRNLKKARAARKGHKRSKKTGKRHASKRYMTGTKWALRYSPGKKGRGKKRGRKAMYSLHLRKNYRRNFGGAMVSDLTKVVKFGTLILSGYVVHRALTKVVDNYGTAKISALAGSQYRGLISSVVTAAVGIPGAMYLGRKTHVDVAPVVGGMAASLLQGVLVTILNAAGQQNVAGYLSGYADGGGRAYRGMGEYYSFKPRQTFNGMGEFYEVLPQSGFGLDTAQLRQAAGSYPQEAVGFTQAPGGMGAAVTQAAGAAGEYIVYGAEGMGDYEEVVPTGNGVATSDGVRPNLHEAEQALNIVEAAGAMGDLPLQMNVNPTVAQRPVAGEPGGSRAGILAGGDGIFG